MKEVKRYQQTFQGTGSAASYSVLFNRIFKQKPEHKFILRVTNLASYQAVASNIPHAIFAVGLDLNGSVNTNTQGDISVSADPYYNNDFCLGFLGNNNSGATATWNHNELMLNDIPLNPFTLAYKHLNSAAYETTALAMCVVFEIIEYEGDYGN